MKICFYLLFLWEWYIWELKEFDPLKHLLQYSQVKN